MELVDYIRNHSCELFPVETGEKPVLPRMTHIKAVVFDIYGTLMISSAGDISLAGGGGDRIRAMSLALKEAKLQADPAATLARYDELVGEHQLARATEFPEVEIREVWAGLLEELGGDPGFAARGCVAYECAANPVWPMPGLIKCLDAIRESGRWSGVISNAQFYTPILFPALTGKTLRELGFDPELLVFSHELKEAKPSRNLYREMSRKLGSKNIPPPEVLYIGNDRLKDIWPAGLEGFRTALFAGDQRSLRWREDDGRLAGVNPDAVITHLDQIVEFLS